MNDGKRPTISRHKSGAINISMFNWFIMSVTFWALEKVL